MKKKLFILFLFLFFLLSLFSSGLVDSLDGLQYLAVSRNIYYKHEPTFPPDEYGAPKGWKNIFMVSIIGRSGKTYTITGLGFSLAMVPAVAITDIVYKIFNVNPPIHFPLENDWLIFLTASFTNMFFAAFLGVIIFLYLREIGLNSKNSLIITFLSIFTTNLFTFSKHITAHMMFLTFMFTTFFFLKKFFSKGIRKYLIFAGISFGIMMITYNATYILPIPAICLYYLLLKKPNLNVKSLKTLGRDLILFLIGALPFIITYYWFENLRAPTDATFSSPTYLIGFLKNKIISAPIGVILEGLWGQLFSPGRSLFIYSPLLITIFIFWFKLKRDIFPELFSFVLLITIYITFYAMQFMVGSPEQGYIAMWSGESSWGPRYISPLIAPAMLIVGYIYQQLKKLQKLLIFIPLSMIGLYVEFLGILMPYQIKYHYLEKSFYLNGTEYNVYSYTNLLPRYSAIFMQSKNLIKLVSSLKNILSSGEYNVRMFDGINFAFDVGPERWRKIEKTGYISFDNNPTNKIKSISFDIINHPISETKMPLEINFEINGVGALPKPITIKIGERKNINLDLSKITINDKKNTLIIYANYSDNKILSDDKQIPGLINMRINDNIVNKEFIWTPYVSPLGPKMTGVTYQNWGGTNLSGWTLWNLHTQTFERLPDFWWFRNLFYWDVPRNLFIGLFLLNLFGVIFLGYKFKKNFLKEK